MRAFTASILVIVLGLSAQAAYALDEPSAASLTQQLTAVVPPYWSVTKTTITASVNSGDAVDPVIKQRFQAIVAPKSELFAEDTGSAAALAPYIPLVPTLGTKETRTLYGVAQSTYSAGHWDTKLHMENSVSKMGKPKSLFPGPTIVRGSQRESKMRSLLAADIAKKIQLQAQSKIEAQKANNESQLRALKANQAKAIDQIKANYAAVKRKLGQRQQALQAKQHAVDTSDEQLQTKIEAQKARHAAKMQQLEAAQAKTIGRLKAKQSVEKRKYQQQLANLKAANQGALDQVKQHHQEKLKALKVAQQAEIERARQTHQAALDTLDAKHKSKLASLKQKHDAALDLLKQKNQQELEGINTQYGHKIKVLQQKIEKTSKLVTLQKKKNKEEAQLADAQKNMLEKRAQHNQNILADFRKKIAADKADARRAAFAAALGSDNPLLRHTAITSALKSSDQVLQATAFQEGLKSSDKTLQAKAYRMGLDSDSKAVRRAAIKAGLASDDAGRRSAALDAALSSKDRDLQHMALTKILSNTNSITGTYQYKGKTRPFTLAVSNFDSTTGGLKGKLLGWSYCDNPPVTGSLAGTNLTLGNKHGCEVGFSLSDSSTMKGSIVDRLGHRYKAQIIVAN